MASLEILTAMESLAYERDRQEFALGDTLDIKTGLILAALTFLALQSGDLIKANMPHAQLAAQSLAIVAIVIGGILSVVELWPRDYAREASPDKYQEWIAKTEAYCEDYPDAEPLTVEKLVEARIRSATASVQINLAINRSKSLVMFWAFACVVVAFGANIATLIIRLF